MARSKVGRARPRRAAIAAGVLALSGVGVLGANLASAGSDRPPEETNAFTQLTASSTDPRVQAIVDWLRAGPPTAAGRTIAASASPDIAEDASTSAQAPAGDPAPPSPAVLDRVAVLSRQVSDASTALAQLWEPNEAAYQAASSSVRQQMIVTFVTKNTTRLDQLRTVVTTSLAELHRISNGG